MEKGYIMAHPTEEDVMRRIGFGQEPNWYNGSGNINILRLDAVKAIPEVIEKMRGGGENLPSRS